MGRRTAHAHLALDRNWNLGAGISHYGVGPEVPVVGYRSLQFRDRAQHSENVALES